MKCCMAAAYTLGIYSDDAVLCKILTLGSKVGSRNSVQFSGPIKLCVLP